MTSALNGTAPLPHLGVIGIEGDDATSFIHAQLTQDFALLGASQGRLAAWCSPKGRVLASFIGYKRSPRDIVLVVRRDILPAMVKRLGMYVLRAKVKVRDLGDSMLLRGLAGPALTNLVGPAAAPWSRVDSGAATVLVLYPCDGVPRGLWIAPVGTAPPPGAELSADAWLHSEVRSGVATIGQALSDAFVPQMLNYESVGGVNFKKGCYPGQEVVARSQFRGTLKRRAVLAHCDAAMLPGQELFLAGETDQPCATVVQSAPSPSGGSDAIVSGQLTALQTGVLQLGSAGGPPVTLAPMPYPLLDDI